MTLDFDSIAAGLGWGTIADRLNPWSVDEPRVAIDYASGSHHAGEILGLADAGIPIGTAAVVEFKRDSAEALLGLAGTGLPIFFDSGAFAEVDAEGRLVKPIPDRIWRNKLALYQRLADALGSQLSVVAPDRVGNQAETLARLQQYARPMRRVAQAGARVLVPVQPGPIPMAQLFERQRQILRIPGVIPSMPMTSKVGLGPDDVAAFLRQSDITEIHLLGVGGKSPRLGPILDAIEAECPGCRVTIDSNKLRALRTRSGGPGDPRAARPALYYGKGWGDPVRDPDRRRLGAVETDRAAAELEEYTFGGDDSLPDYTDFIGQPGDWLSRGRRQEIARWIGLNGSEAASFVRDPDAWLQQDQRYLWPHVEAALDRAWTRYFFEKTGTERKRLATAATFDRLRAGDDRPVELRVALVSCAAQKESRPAEARTLYTSGLFTSARDHVEGRGLPWYVLSAKHGLVAPDQIIAPYDERLIAGKSPAKVRARRPWARQVVQQLYDELGDLQGIVFELHSGRDYVDPLRRLLERQGAVVIEPLKGLQIGQRLSWYKQRR